MGKRKPRPLILFGVEHTRKPCPSCLRSPFLRRETILPVAPGARAPLSHLKGLGSICFDCQAAETLQRMQGLTWEQARIATANCRQEKLRLPGAPIGLPHMLHAQDGDLEKLHDWQDATLPEEVGSPW